MIRVTKEAIKTIIQVYARIFMMLPPCKNQNVGINKEKGISMAKKKRGNNKKL
jgi:hypothetical protein